jgi:twitching motility two-component system response regulator PilG
MNTIPKGTYKPVQKLHPLSLLAQFISRGANGCLQISSSGSSWFLYLEQGKLVYASDLIDPFGRLDRHLRRLSLQVPSLVSAVRVQVRLMFETPTSELPIPNSDYQAICWLVEQQHLSPEQAATLIAGLAREVIEALLPIQTGSYEFVEQDLLADFSKFCQLDLRALVEECQTQMRRRQAATPAISIAERFSANRFNLLSALPNQTASDHSALSRTSDAASFTPEPLATSTPAPVVEPAVEHTVEPVVEPIESVEFVQLSEAAETTELAAPNEPIEPAESVESATGIASSYRLSTASNGTASFGSSESNSQNNTLNQTNYLGQINPPAVSSNPQFQRTSAYYKPAPAPAPKTYTIACIDDSPTVLQAINAFLDDRSFSVILINDPVKALMQIIRSKPDLILLDVTMPNLDGYELCSLLRKHPSFRGTPIIMVTGNTGFIDRAKARLVGSSGYLTKPFTQSDLVKMVFKHLS